ncbi:autotransporter outer membrane beta-barrel domain-containing protein, partial [Aestuariivita sp.]|uniref:autotransporter outer membrane beta-barrel domain-containing protein n=1 Tax=Aestuariivita sp. TaxID=1872407 RepID=UPI00216C7F5E
GAVNKWAGDAIPAPGSLGVAPGGGGTSFTVSYTPLAAGPFSFDLSLTNDDADEAPYDIRVNGTATATASELIATSGSGQATIINTSFPEKLVATVVSPTGVGSPNVSVTFTAPLVGASLIFASTGNNTETVLTDANGRATSSAMTANGTASTFLGGGAFQPYTVIASAAAVTDVTYSLTNDRDSNADILQTQEVIASFVTNRADRIVSSQPDLVDRLKGGGGTASNSFSFNATPNSRTTTFQFSYRALQKKLKAAASQRYVALTPAETEQSLFSDTGPAVEASLNPQSQDNAAQPKFAFSEKAQTVYEDGASRRGFDFWAQGTYSVVESGNSESEHGLIFAGVDYRFSEDALIGIMGQVDISDEKNLVANTSADGVGWMIGPYAVVRLSQNLYFDGRLTYGESSNTVNALGLFDDDFSTKRALLQGGLTGDFRTGDFTINPFIRATYYWEKQESYLDTLGNFIPSQTFDLGRIEFGPKITYHVPINRDADLELYMSLSGIYDFDELLNAPATNAALASSGSSLRGRITAGSVYRVPAREILFSAELFYDGIGADGFEAYGGTISLEFPF